MITKKTYIPGKPRNKKLTNVTSGAAISNIRSEINQIEGSINQKINEVGQKINDIKVGNNNLLRNTGFLGDFNPMDVDALTAVLENTPVGTNPLVHWVHNNTEVIDAPSRSGKGVRIGSLQQTVSLKSGETYTLQFKAKGSGLTVVLVDSIEVELTNEYDTYGFAIVASETKAYTFGLFDTSNTAEVYEIMLSEGNTDVDYAYAAEDDLKAISQLQAINAITSVIKEFDTATLGGLILTSMIQLGKYKNGVMEEVNAGISGIYNSGDDPAAWFGGNLEKAIRTVQRLKSNPYNVSDEEWEELANIVFTHGGDGFFKGIIYALGGIFRGRVESNASGNRIVIDPSDGSIKAYGSDDKVRFSLSFIEDEEESVTTILQLDSYQDGELAIRTRLRPLGLSMQTFKGDPMYSANYSLNGFNIIAYDGVSGDISMNVSLGYNSISGVLEFQIKGLPSSTPSMPDRLYKENGYLKIT